MTSDRPFAGNLLRLLIIEDSAADVELEVGMLKRAGYALSYDAVATPDGLREKLGRNEYDLILCDHNLGTWMGTEALEIVQQRHKHIPVVVVTAALGDEAAVEYFKRGAADYVLKHRLPRLAGVVAAALRGKAHQEEAQRLQEAIKRAKREWELTFDAVPEPVCLLDEQCRILRANRAAAEMLGVTYAQLIGKHWCESLDPGAKHGEDCLLARKLRESDRPQLDIAVARLGRIFDTTASLVRDAGGALTGYVCVMRDITERRQAEEALRESEELFRSLFEEAPVAYHEIDSEGIIRRVNRTECNWLGYGPGEMLGRPAWDFVVPEQRETARAAVREKMRAPFTPAPFQREWLCRDGRRLTVEMHENLILGAQGEVLAIRTAVLDITERRQAEEALRESEERYRSLFENAPYGIYRVALDGRLLQVNPAFVAMLGYGSKHELLARNILTDVYSTPEERLRLVEQALQSGRFEDAETEFRRRDGTLIAVRLVGRILRQPDGAVAGFEMMAENVTERKHLEEQFRQVQKMEAIGRLAGGVAHDFNNLLMVIRGYGDLLLEQLEEGDRRRRSADEIVKAAERAASLTRQLLAFSRKQVLQPRVLDLNAVVANLGKMLPRLIGEDVQLATILQPGLGRVKADPGQLEQVLMNLAVNARDAMPQGGKLTVETADAELDEEYAAGHPDVAPGRYVCLAVSDTGCGMDAETRAYIFEPFFTTKERGRGTGLGLPTVYGIIKQSGGHIWVYSEVDKGTVFKIYLPTIAQMAEEAAAADRPEPPGSGHETILLVEDESDVRAILCDVLSHSGYKVLEAGEGSEALRVCGQHPEPIHLIITDLVMPRMGGRELIERLCALRPESRVIYMSGYTDDTLVHAGVLEAGIPFLQKPFTSGAVVRKVREVLDATPLTAARTAPGT
jgi:PAS domain S-box-containing protein